MRRGRRGRELKGLIILPLSDTMHGGRDGIVNEEDDLTFITMA